jgi:hypothetical protein
MKGKVRLFLCSFQFATIRISQWFSELHFQSEYCLSGSNWLCIFKSVSLAVLFSPKIRGWPESTPMSCSIICLRCSVGTPAVLLFSFSALIWFTLITQRCVRSIWSVSIDKKFEVKANLFPLQLSVFSDITVYYTDLVYSTRTIYSWKRIVHHCCCRNAKTVFHLSFISFVLAFICSSTRWLKVWNSFWTVCLKRSDVYVPVHEPASCSCRVLVPSNLS